ncbi:hypothetical protein CTAYLR_000799 [Chrysophaeum taylorii]|uniref:Exonuclease 1 n=1 Tax=Chrysophaeum taylorii TaxID=2483200 RepID=A0AAD7UP90_9STRA|nr:hypothetical protein CTAYLR_000799 [Chrysophaeum taylorii]
MGVNGLLRALSAREVHISKYANQVVAVDGYAWLHRGVHSCAWELGCGGDSDKWIRWCMQRVALLLHYRVKPLLIFDGGPLPAKADQEATRRAKREEARARALQLTRERRHDEAAKWFAKAVDVTPVMAARLVDACVARWGRGSVDFVIAPYEADAQLSYACQCGESAAVISEDSDNLAYGTSRVLFKLEASGAAQEMVVSELLNGERALTPGEEIDVRGWTPTMFRFVLLLTMCVLSGCDYAENVRGVGIKAAHRLVSRHRETRRVIRALRYEFGKNVPTTYERDVERAVLTYEHQTVFCRRTRTTRYLSPLPDDVTKRHEDLSFLGQPLPADVAVGIAEARLDPMHTHSPLLRAPPPPSLVQASLAHATKDLDQMNKVDAYFAPKPKQPAAQPNDRLRRSPRDADDARLLTVRHDVGDDEPPKRDEAACKRSSHFPPPSVASSFPRQSSFGRFKIPVPVADKENKPMEASSTPAKRAAKRVAAPFAAFARVPETREERPRGQQHKKQACFRIYDEGIATTGSSLIAEFAYKEETDGSSAPP